jgi:RNA polymerase sigma factor (sigma-70 family)
VNGWPRPCDAPRDDRIQWDEARAFLRERIAAQLRPLDGDALEDLTQEALVRLLRAVRREEADSLSGLMHEIARRTCIDLIRRRRRWGQVLRPMAEGAPEPAAPSLDSGGLGDPLERMRFTVLEFFRLNEAPCRDVAAAYFEGQDWQTVAARMGRSYSAIRKQWSRCVQHLRTAARSNPGWLAEWLGDE